MLQELQRRLYLRDPLAELPVDDHRAQVRVVVEIPQLVFDVPVVHVDRHRADLEAREHPLDVLGSVEKLEPDVVAAADADGRQVVGEAVGAIVECSVCETPLARDDGFTIGNGVTNHLE